MLSTPGASSNSSGTQVAWLPSSRLLRDATGDNVAAGSAGAAATGCSGLSTLQHTDASLAPGEACWL